METAQAIKLKKKKLIRMQSSLRGAARDPDVFDEDLWARKFAFESFRDKDITEKEFRSHTKPWTFHFQPGDYEGDHGSQILGQTDYGKQTVSISKENVKRYWEFQEGEETDKRRHRIDTKKITKPTFWDGVVSDRLLRDIQGPPVYEVTTTKRKPLERYSNPRYKPKGKRSWEMGDKDSTHKPLPKGAYKSEKDVGRHVALHEVAHMKNPQRTRRRVADQFLRELTYWDSKDQEAKLIRTPTIVKDGQRHVRPTLVSESDKKYEQRMDRIAWDMKEGEVPNYPASRANKVISRKRKIETGKKVAKTVGKSSLGVVGTAIDALNPPELGRGSDRGYYKKHMEDASPWSGAGIQKRISNVWKRFKKHRDKKRPLVR